MKKYFPVFIVLLFLCSFVSADYVTGGNHRPTPLKLAYHMTMYVGQRYGFYGFWYDYEHDNVKMLLCKTDGLQFDGDGTPHCLGGDSEEWCSNDYGSDSPAICAINAPVAVGSYTAYFFVCDEKKEGADSCRQGSNGGSPEFTFDVQSDAAPILICMLAAYDEAIHQGENAGVVISYVSSIGTPTDMTVNCGDGASFVFSNCDAALGSCFGTCQNYNETGDFDRTNSRLETGDFFSEWYDCSASSTPTVSVLPAAGCSIAGAAPSEIEQAQSSTITINYSDFTEMPHLLTSSTCADGAAMQWNDFSGCTLAASGQCTMQCNNYSELGSHNVLVSFEDYPDTIDCGSTTVNVVLSTVTGAGITLDNASTKQCDAACTATTYVTEGKSLGLELELYNYSPDIIDVEIQAVVTPYQPGTIIPPNPKFGPESFSLQPGKNTITLNPVLGIDLSNLTANQHYWAEIIVSDPAGGEELDSRKIAFAFAGAIPLLDAPELSPVFIVLIAFSVLFLIRKNQ